MRFFTLFLVMMILFFAGITTNSHAENTVGYTQSVDVDIGMVSPTVEKSEINDNIIIYDKVFTGNAIGCIAPCSHFKDHSLSKLYDKGLMNLDVVKIINRGKSPEYPLLC
jgi:hypothetical protein